MKQPHGNKLATILLLLLCLQGLSPASAQSDSPDAPPEEQRFLPLVLGPLRCESIPDETYALLAVEEPYPDGDGPPEEHPDLNLGLRGYTLVDEHLGLVEYQGGSDSAATPPQLRELFADERVPVFRHVYQVFQWDGNWPGVYGEEPITDPVVTLAGFETVPGEAIHVPDSGYTLGQGFEVLVLYAERSRLTLKYTAEDHVIHGYTIHIEDICVEPRLLALYQEANLNGRERLPALRAGQAMGRAMEEEIKVAIRDAGSFMDPRSRKDWWQSVPLGPRMPIFDHPMR